MRKYEIAVISKGAFARTVRIYAPKKSTRAVIMHDGQNAFCDADAAFGKSWRVLDILKAASIKNTAIIAVDSVAATRNDDYMPFPSEIPDIIKFDGHNAETYASYISEMLLPYLDKRFGFKRYAMLGSSAGAMFTLYYAARRDERISAYGLFSTPLFPMKVACEKFLSESVFDKNAYYCVYTGGNENTDGDTADLYVDDAVSTVKSLRRSGATDIDLIFDNGAEHDETFWRAPEKAFFEKFSRLK